MSKFKEVSKDSFDYMKPYIIAEIGVNHEGSMDKAKEMIDQVARAGGHAAKFQTYKADLIASKNSPSYWDLSKESSTSQHKLFQKFDSFEEKDYVELAEHCKKVGVDFMSTPFDLGAVDMLNPLMPIFKIASADITNIPLIRKIAKQGKPVIVSTGASTKEEIEIAVNELKKAGCQSISLLHCVLNYPTPESHAQISGIKTLQEDYSDLPIGYSDHVAPNENGDMPALELATIMGSVIIEKHFTFDKSLEGNDHYHAMDEKDLKLFVDRIKQYENLYGGTNDKNLDWEESARTEARRSIVLACDVKKGDIFTEENLIAKRPAHGISPLHWDEIIGKAANCDIESDELLKWEQIQA